MRVGVRDAPNYGFLSMVHEMRTDWAMLLGSLFLMLAGGGPYALRRFYGILRKMLHPDDPDGFPGEGASAQAAGADGWWYAGAGEIRFLGAANLYDARFCNTLIGPSVPKTSLLIVVSTRNTLALS